MARDYQFNTGPQTATLPTATAPTVASDLATKDYVDTHSGGVVTSETQFTVGNNSSATSVTGMLLDNTTYRSYIFLITIERRTTTQGYRATGFLICNYDAFSSTWTCEFNILSGSAGATTGVAFTMSTEQVQIAADNMSGSTYVGKMRWAAFKQFLKET